MGWCHRSGPLEMNPLAPRRRQAGEDGLANKFVGKLKPRFGTFHDRANQAGFFGLFDGVEKRVSVGFTRSLEDFKTEEAADHGRRREHPLREIAQPRQSPSDDQPHTRRRVQLANLELGAKLSRRIVQSIFLFEMTKQFLDEERIAFGLGEY